jgi:hypothetical protein
METEKRCPTCAEWRYISLVNVCPICKAPGKSHAAEEFLRVWETGTFEQMWDSIRPAVN